MEDKAPYEVLAEEERKKYDTKIKEYNQVRIYGVCINLFFVLCYLLTYNYTNLIIVYNACFFNFNLKIVFQIIKIISSHFFTILIIIITTTMLPFP